MTVARNRFGPPGRRAELRILYAEGGERDRCLARDDLLRDDSPSLPPPPALSSGSRPMRLLHLYWPHLPLRLARARHSDSFPTDRPVVLGGQPWTDGTVIDADPAARALGVRRGIPLGSAHRLAPEAAFLDPEPDADAAAVEAAFEALARFSPGSGRHHRPGRSGVRAARGPGRRARATVGRRARARRAPRRAPSRPILPGAPRPGIAGTRFAATVAAANATPPEPRIVRPGGEAAFLAPLPASLLTPDPDVQARLRRFGLRRIGAVAELPRSALVARFGDEGERLLARAQGQEIAPFRPRRAPERLALALPIEPAVGELDPLRFVLHRLAGALADQLQARGTAAARAHLRLTLDLSFAPPGPRPSSASSSASPNRPRTPRRSSGSSSPASSGRRRRRRCRGSSSSWPASSRPSGISSRCSSRRRPGMRGSAGSLPGSR